MRRKKTEVLAIIPARGGSKSIPKKNVKLFNGHPLIAYSIAAGLKAREVSRVLVSTDDAKIAEVSSYYTAEGPFLRPAQLARDDTPDLPVFLHALRWLKNKVNYQPDIVVQLRPTSPLRPEDCVDRAISTLLRSPEADSVRAVTPAAQNPYKMWHIKNRFLTPVVKTPLREAFNVPRQRLPQVYWQTGHIDVIRYGTIIGKHSMTGSHIVPFITDPAYTVDLDTLYDWEFAEWNTYHRNLNIVRPEQPPFFIKDIRLLVLDFDGVLTDNMVYISRTGKEEVACNRSDGLGLAILKEIGIKVIVLSSEKNPVVSQRCKKLGLKSFQGLNNKADMLKKIILEGHIPAQNIAYVGNDVNDLACMRMVGFSVAVANAHSEVLRIADYVLSKPGGRGAVREICDLISFSLKR